MRARTGIIVPIVLALYWTNGATGTPVPADEASALTLNIVHTNDMHSRFVETSADEQSTSCSPEDKSANKCYGGFARIATLVRQARNLKTPTLVLNAGDTYQGTEWFTVHKWKIVSKFLEILAPNATTLGNHEFDNKPKGLVPFLEAAKYPVVCANLDLTGEPELAASKLKNSTILVVNGVKIGIIGYLTNETKKGSDPGNVIFLDEVMSVSREVAALKAQGVKILIALGHSGYEKDLEVAAKVDGIDLIIGGHTNTFLYNGDPPDFETPEGPYPVVVTQENGRKVYVVQAYAYTKYLGNLTIDFDAAGEITNIFGNPILVNSNVEQAPDVLKELNNWRKEIDALDVEVGSTKVHLDATRPRCRKQECNLGNLLTDAMVDYNAKRYVNPNAWTDAAIAIFNTGSIRASIPKEKDEKIRQRHITKVLPFADTLEKVTMKGSTLRKFLKHAVRSLTPSHMDPDPQFLQFSGVQVTYDLTKPTNSRVYSVMVRYADCNIPTYAKLKNDTSYGILMPRYMHSTRGGYPEPNDEQPNSGISIEDVLIEYLKKGPVHSDIEGRIGYLTRCQNGNTFCRSPSPMA